MKQSINIKSHNIKKVKTYFKTNKFFIFYNSVNKDSNNWLITEQMLSKVSFDYYKILNKITGLNLKKSIYFNTNSIIFGVTFLFKPKESKNHISKKIIINNFKNFFFYLTTLKLNNKIYSANQIKQINSLDYKNNMLLMFHSLIANKKFNYKNKKSK